MRLREPRATGDSRSQATGDLGNREQQVAQRTKATGDSEGRPYKLALWLKSGKADYEKLKMDSEDQGRPMLSATCIISRPSRESDPKTALAGTLLS